MLSPQSPIHLERTPPVWSPTAAGFFRFDIIHIRKGSPMKGSSTYGKKLKAKVSNQKKKAMAMKKTAARKKSSRA